MTCIDALRSGVLSYKVKKVEVVPTVVKHHIEKMYGKVEVRLYVIFTSAPDRGELAVSFPALSLGKEPE
jgi:hypothetical protein